MSRLSDGLPEAVLIPSDEVYADAKGRLRRGTTRVLPQERIPEYTSGMRCWNCDIAQDEAFPEVCKEVYKDGGGCGYRMRDRQSADISRDLGEVDLWPANRFDTDVEQERWEQTRSGLIKPR